MNKTTQNRATHNITRGMRKKQQRRRRRNHKIATQSIYQAINRKS
jgi:hypothetical protein